MPVLEYVAVYPRLMMGARPNKLSERSVSWKTQAVNVMEVCGIWSWPVAMG
jgi:hypothetical protein